MNNYNTIDPAPITRLLRSRATSELLVCAVHHLKVFELLAEKPRTPNEISETVGLKQRPSMVLFPALCAMGLLRRDEDSRLNITDLGKFAVNACAPDLASYIALDKENAGVLHMLAWLRNDGPEEAGIGLSYVRDNTAASPMDVPEAAEFFTMALAGRAKLLSPLVAQTLPHGATLLDVAGGTGYFSYEWLNLNPTSTAVIFDRPEVLKIAKQLLEVYCTDRNNHSLKERVSFLEGDMLTDALPSTDLLLAASLYHDWPEAICEQLTMKFAAALRPGGQLWIHDSFLNDELDGPLHATDYSAILFLGTKGRLYSRKEYRNWMSEAGLIPSAENIPTMMDYGLISARKNS